MINYADSQPDCVRSANDQHKYMYWVKVVSVVLVERIIYFMYFHLYNISIMMTSPVLRNISFKVYIYIYMKNTYIVTAGYKLQQF